MLSALACRRKHPRGRPSRVVLISRRWDQACGRRTRRRRRLSSPALRGEREAAVKTIAQGMPVVPVLPVVTAACFFCCRRAMGAACIRHSLRPPDFEDARRTHHPGMPCRGNAEVCPIVIARSASDEAIQTVSADAIARARIRPGSRP